MQAADPTGGDGALRVLIAEDSAATRRLLEETVSSLGYECAVAEDGTAAWERFERGGIDVVISDWMMPGMDGDELCRRIRAANAPYAYFILFTSLDDREHIRLGMEAGADDYLTKPLDEYELASRLTAASRVSALHRRLGEQQQELEQLNREFFEQARRDPLTGLWNRLRLAEDLETLEGRFERYEDVYAVVLVDIDHFKEYNDAFGHAAGDDVLRSVSGTLVTAARRGDSVYRFGGEEFLLVVPQQDLEHGRAAAERMREAVEALAIAHAPEAGEAVVTVSAGVAARGEIYGGPDAILRAADRALYEAKGAGRNRVAVGR